MQTITHFYEHLKNVKSFNEKYPNYDPSDGKVHILYISPRLRAQEYYSAILPAVELNGTITHSAIITDIELYDQDKSYFDTIKEIDVRLLRWANYIVFPTILAEMKYIINILRFLYPKLHVVMHLDDNYHKLPRWHSHYKKIAKQAQMELVETIHLLDICICHNERLEKQYISALDYYYKNSNCLITTLPTLVSRKSFENLTPIKKDSDDKIRIGVFSASEKFLSYLPSLIEKLSKRNRNISFIIFDYKGKRKAYDKKLAIEFYNDVPYTSYLEKVHQLRLTIALFSVSEYGEFDSIHSYLEMAVLGVAVIACKSHPASSIISKQESGLIIQNEQDWEFHINTLLDKRKYRKRLSSHAAKMAWRNHSFTKMTLKKITAIFI